MSEPKLISPMLDNYIMGDPVSDRNGVRCCPAMEKDSDNKFIVKIISVPASASQIDALLLTGAYSDKAQALSYFKDVADGILDEAQALNALSKLEGFISFDKWQLVPMEDESGYDVYLLGSYKKSLDKVFRTGAMTHLSALNLGLDLCSALSVCRRSGYLYIDLKPENIYLADEQGYRIGDLGFMKLDSLKYASLPDRYRSRYTAPEIADAFSSLNTTLDVYAVGLILYQAFNGGILPAIDAVAPEAPLPAPDYADYEMAEIILKACSPDPSARWADPVEMGQALVSYMQRNGAHDTPIVPVPVPVSESETLAADTVDEVIAEPAAGPEEAVSEPIATASEEENIADASASDSVYAEDNDGNLSFLINDSNDETLPGQADEEIDDEQPVSEEVSDMLNQADELIAHPTPDPVVAPDPIDVPIPAPLPAEPEQKEADALTESEETPDASDAAQDDHAPADSDLPEEAETEADDAVAEDAPDSNESDLVEEEPRPHRHWLRNSLLVLLGLVLLAGGFVFYKFYYLQNVTSMVLQGSKDQLTVYVTSDVADSKLTVVCSDTYGNKLTEPVVNGAAFFENLAPGMPYTVNVEIQGFHKLTGETSKGYTTPPMTAISQFTAVTGQEDGSVILTFTADGPGTKDWKVTYGATGEAEKEVTFSGVMTTITGLTVGNTYTFKLTPVEDIYVTGANEIEHTASKLLLAENLSVTSCYNGTLNAQWSAPEGTSVTSWTVRCYNELGYNETIVTDQTTVTFNGTTDTDGYTVEVLAAGMSVNQRVDVSKNSITVTDFQVTDDMSSPLQLSWSSSNAPESESWIILYSMDGSPAQKIDVTETNACAIPRIPGATYTVSLQAASGNSVLGGQLTYTTEAAKDFDNYGVDAQHIEFKMCVTPKDKDWNRYDVKEYTTTFSVGEKASFLARLRESYKVSSDTIEILYVIRDQAENVVSFASNSQKWRSMWYNSYGEFDIPNLPGAAGSYSISIYFNGALAGQQNFTITN